MSYLAAAYDGGGRRPLEVIVRAPKADSSVVTGYDGIVLAGPPASGTSTVAFTLMSLSRNYVRFSALTARTDHYESSVDSELTTSRYIDDLRVWGQIFHEFRRDGITFVFDRERIVRTWQQGRLPVASVDNTKSLHAFSGDLGHWLTVLLWCPRDVVEARAAWLRRSGGTPGDESRGGARMRTWNRSARDLSRNRSEFVLSLRTDRIPTVAIAQMIHVAAQAPAYAPTSTVSTIDASAEESGDRRADGSDSSPPDSTDQHAESG